MINELNSQAFEFVKLITLRSRQTSYQNLELKGSAKERGINDFSDRIDGNGVARVFNDAEKIVAIFLFNGDDGYGLDEKPYPLFAAFVSKISKLGEFKNTVSTNFIEQQSFEWIIDIYQNKQAAHNLIDHLRAETEKIIEEHEFYFPVLNLETESPFRLGNVEFIFFTKEYMDDLYKSYQSLQKPMSESDFNKILRTEYQGKLLAKVKVSAEREKAEEIAKRDAEIAVDVLKIYSSTLLIPEQRIMLGLNYRPNYPVRSNFLAKEAGKKNGFVINMQWNNPLFELTNTNLDFAFKNGMQAFSKYITLKKEDEFYNLIFQAIHFIASAFSNWDLNSRCVNIITSLESLLLKDDEEKDLERRAKARLAKVMSNDHKEKEKIKEIFGGIYQVRHKMIHKAKKIDVNVELLRQAQLILVDLLVKLMDLNTNKGFTEKNILIERLNEEKS